MIVPPILAALIWWRLAKLRKAAFKAEFTTVVVSALAMTAWLLFVAHIQSANNYQPFAEFYFYYFCTLILLAGLFLWMHGSVVPQAPKHGLISEVLLAATFVYSLNVLIFILPLSGYIWSVRSWLELYWRDQESLGYLGMFIAPFVVVFLLLAVLARVTKYEALSRLSAGTLALLIVVTYFAGLTIQTTFESFIPPRLARKAWLLEMDFGTGLSPYNLQRHYVEELLGKTLHADKTQVLLGALDSGFTLLDNKYSSEWWSADAVYKKGASTVSIFDAAVSSWDAIQWTDFSLEGLPVAGLTQPVSKKAFEQNFGASNKEPRPLITAHHNLLPGHAEDDYEFLQSSLSYETGTLGLDTLSLYFLDDRLAIAEYWPQHHDRIAPWEMPYVAGLLDEMSMGRTFWLIPLLPLAIPLVIFLAVRLDERRMLKTKNTSP
jgi:hypothetical protein